MFYVPLMKLWVSNEKNINFEHIMTYFWVEKIVGTTIRDNSVDGIVIQILYYLM